MIAPSTRLRDRISDFAATDSRTSERGPDGTGIEGSRIGAGPLADYAALKRAAPNIDNPVLSEAIAPLRLREPALASLGRAETAPDFLCIGVQKAATTWFYEISRTHPQLRPAAVKELNFFNRRAFPPGSAFVHDGLKRRLEGMIRNYARTAERFDPTWLRLLAHLYDARMDGSWYEEIFRFYPDPARRTGEFTPEYVMLPEHCIRELRNFAPNIKLVLMLREPVARIRSHVGMLVDQVPAAAPFADALACEQAVLARSRYDVLVPRWQAAFGPDQLKIVTHEAILAAPHATAADIASFIGIDPGGFDRQAVERKVFQGNSRVSFVPETVARLDMELADPRRLYRELCAESGFSTP